MVLVLKCLKWWISKLESHNLQRNVFAIVLDKWIISSCFDVIIATKLYMLCEKYDLSWENTPTRQLVWSSLEYLLGLTSGARTTAQGTTVKADNCPGDNCQGRQLHRQDLSKLDNCIAKDCDN